MSLHNAHFHTISGLQKGAHKKIYAKFGVEKKPMGVRTFGSKEHLEPKTV